MTGPIHVRPERTAEEIEADAKLAEEFFATVYRGPLGLRDLERMIRYHSYAEHLVHCAFEGAGVWQRFRPTTAERQRRAALKASRTIPTSGAFRPYVHESTRALLPDARVHPVARAEQKRNTERSWGWFRRWSTYSEDWITRRVERDHLGYARWAVSAANQRPMMRQSEDPRPQRTLNVANYRHGQIRPSGMTPERAMAIAARVLSQQSRA